MCSQDAIAVVPKIKMKRIGLTLAVLGVLHVGALSAASTAVAEPPTTRPAGDAGDGSGKGKDRPENGYWSVGKPRFFVAARPELGTPYAKPYVSAGYGMPHWIWVGVDVNAIFTLEMAQAYAGLRAATPIFDLAFGVRDTWSFSKTLMVPERSFTADDVSNGPGGLARYWAWEAEAVAVAPLPHSALVADFIVVRTLDVPRDRFLYEESYRAIISKPLFLTIRFAAVVRFLAEDSLRIGVLTEHVFETGRDRPVWRVGPIASMQLTDHLEAMAGVTLAVYSPDDLGIGLGSYGIAGVRWRWASGEDDPQPPWRGNFIPW
jgi:hypothetical protein